MEALEKRETVIIKINNGFLISYEKKTFMMLIETALYSNKH